MTEYRIIVVGIGGVGKSATVIRWINDHFVQVFDPTIEETYRKQIKVDDEVCLIDVLDTGGPEEYSALRDSYYAVSHGFIGVFSLASHDSFLQLQMYIDFAMKVRSVGTQKRKEHRVPFPLVIVGNKCDLVDDREVTTQEAEELAKSLQAPYFETSAKHRTNIDEIFEEIVREVRKSRLDPTWWEGKYRMSATFYGDQSSGLSDLLSYVASKKVEIPAYIPLTGRYLENPHKKNDLVIVNSTKYPLLNYRVWASDPRLAGGNNVLPRPTVCLFCFSVVNRTSYEQVIATWNKELNEYRKYEVITILVGTRTEVRDWVLKDRKAKSIQQPSIATQTEPPTSLQPFASVPDEIVIHIFSYLPMLDNVIFACKRFAKIAQHPSLEYIRWGMIQLPVITRKEAEEKLKEMKGTKYIECSMFDRTGLEELSLDDLFEKYVKEGQEKSIQEQIASITNPKTKKKKKRFLFF